jgi:hypothetical protein
MSTETGINQKSTFKELQERINDLLAAQEHDKHMHTLTAFCPLRNTKRLRGNWYEPRDT